ncbi:MAG: nuclear transport factor 2 family protein [Myxococcota bacterium]|nr:nuclear transport factor 2 family protein [Myxococcota bacterium]
MAAIDTCIENWHRHLRGELPGGLDALLAEDVVFHSPIVFTPQKGRDLTKLYLTAAGTTFGGEAGVGGPKVGASFRYAKEVRTHPHAVLEFETEVDGKVVNGVDIITCDEEARIVEFKVMIRPLQAVNVMHRRMAEMLERMRGA